MPSLELEDRFISILERGCGMGGKEHVGTVKTSLCSKAEPMFPEHMFVKSMNMMYRDM